MIEKTSPTQIPGADKTIGDSLWILHRLLMSRVISSVALHELILFPRILKQKMPKMTET